MHMPGSVLMPRTASWREMAQLSSAMVSFGTLIRQHNTGVSGLDVVLADETHGTASRHQGVTLACHSDSKFVIPVL